MFSSKLSFEFEKRLNLIGNHNSAYKDETNTIDLGVSSQCDSLANFK